MNRVSNVTASVSSLGTGKPLTTLDVVVIGAGPYGLSAGAHLQTLGVSIRVFGEPMDFWATRMPEGMLLRSPREASNMSDPDHAFTLDGYESVLGSTPCAPIPLNRFVEYGRWFQHQLGSNLDKRTVARVEDDRGDFRVTLNDGECFRSRRIVVAAGIGSFQRRPPVFESLSPLQVSHCYDGCSPQRFRGQRVVVIGSGQSALESAALLHEAGADVEVIARNESVHWVGMHKWLHHLGPISHLLYSKHDVGPAGISRLVAAPKLVSHVPLGFRDKIRTRAVRPAGARWLLSRLTQVRITTGRAVQTAKPDGSAVRLELDDASARQVDHVLLGTGYSVDIARYGFLAPDLLSRVRQSDGYPSLKAGFSSSVLGLHFIGAAAARSFGPLMYFVAGTEFTSRELTSYIKRNSTQGRN
jgi:hypothetical protein